MNDSPMVSVVIPAYNVAPFIAATLDSVLAQTFADYEIIVVNDGSPDTGELERALEPYRSRIRYLKQDNRGAAAARNAALRAARGEFAAFLDADDLWLPNYLERQLAFIRERGCDLVSANALIFGDASDAGQTYMEAHMKNAPPSGEAAFEQLLSGERCLITSGVLVRRALVLEAGLFDEALRNAQDLDLWLRLARRKARLAYHDEVLLRYRGRSSSLSGDSINVHRRELRVFDKIETSYGLAPEEREGVLAVIRKRRASLEYEIGKLQLLHGAFAEACASFSRANGFEPGWKPRLALRLTRAAPRLLQAVYARRAKPNRG
jgi:glycosyltransferase involved in cell wall biosynthesis